MKPATGILVQPEAQQVEMGGGAGARSEIDMDAFMAERDRSLVDQLSSLKCAVVALFVLNVITVLALVVVAVAMREPGTGSIGTLQLENSAVTAVKLATTAVAGTNNVLMADGSGGMTWAACTCSA